MLDTTLCRKQFGNPTVQILIRVLTGLAAHVRRETLLEAQDVDLNELQFGMVLDEDLYTEAGIRSRNLSKGDWNIRRQKIIQAARYGY